MRPNVFTYNSVISACGKARQWERACDLLERCESAGIKPNMITYSSAISVCQNAGRTRDAMVLLERSAEVVDREGRPEIDLHGLTAAVAVSAVECWLASLAVGVALGLGRSLPNILVIITGRGSHSDDGDARLRNVMLRLLNHQLQPALRASVDDCNAGRVIVRKADLEAWARAAIL